MRKLLKKLLLLSLPFVAVFLVYFAFDPFKVLRHYSSYYESGKSFGVYLNRDYVSTQHWLDQHQDRSYDSYILGGSSSGFFAAASWARHIGVKTENVYHFDGSGDGLYGMEKKISLLAKSDVPLKNALLTFKYTTLGQTKNSSGHIYMKHPILSGQTRTAFHLKFFRTFLNFSFLKTFIEYKWTGEITKAMQKEEILDARIVVYDNITNEIKLAVEDSIQADPERFYKATDVFFERDTIEKCSPREVFAEQVVLLKKIARVFKEKGTSYRIVLVPRYDQLRVAPEDTKYLRDIFGSENVFDFSGINKFSASKYDYYETTHFRPHIADQLMDSMYRSP